MWRLVLIAMVCTSCDDKSRELVPKTPFYVDPCTIITQADADGLFGMPAVRQPAAPNECVWRCDCGFPDTSSVVLHVSVVVLEKSTRDGTLTSSLNIGTLQSGSSEPRMIVERAGLDRDHHNELFLELKVKGPSAPKASTMAAELKRLAQRVEATYKAR